MGEGKLHINIEAVVFTLSDNSDNSAFSESSAISECSDNSEFNQHHPTGPCRLSIDEQNNLYIKLAHDPENLFYVEPERSFIYRTDELEILWRQNEENYKLKFTDRSLFNELTKQLKVYQKSRNQNEEQAMDSYVLKAVADELTHSWSNGAIHTPETSPRSSRSQDSSQPGTPKRDSSPKRENSEIRTPNSEKRERRILTSNYSTPNASRRNTPVTTLFEQEEYPPGEEKPPYYTAIKTLQKICDLKSPRDKLGCILQTFKDTIQCVSDYWEPRDREPVVGADDLVPIFAYVILRAQIPKLFSEMNFIWEFANDHEMNGKFGYGFATFQIGVEAVARLDDSIFNEKGGTQDTQSSCPTATADTTNTTTQHLDDILEKRDLLINRRASLLPPKEKDEEEDDF